MNFLRLVTVAFLLASCVPSRLSQNKLMHPFDKQGHRGCRGLLPENTLAAMKKAVDLGVTTLEMDAVITADGQVILSHEPFFNHEISTKPDGNFVTEAEERSLNLYRMPYEQVKNFDVGRKPHPRFPQQQKMPAVKPLLGEVIDSIKRYCKERNAVFPQWNIETKSLPLTDDVFHPKPGPFVEALMAVVNQKDIGKNVIIQSFDFRTLQYLHARYPEIKTAMLVEGDDKRGLDELLNALGFSPTIFSPAFELVTEDLVRQCHEKKIRVIPWTVNDKAEMQKLVKTGVDGIITDYPNLFSELGY